MYLLQKTLILWLVLIPVAGHGASWPSSSLRQSIEHALIKQPFPIQVESEASDESSRVAISAVIPVSFAELSDFYRDDQRWCRGFFANVYVKACYKKPQQVRLFYDNNDEYHALDDAFRFDYKVENQSLDASHLLISLISKDGPLGTHDYLLQLEAEPYAESKSIIRLVYKNSYGFVARSALYIYLKTLGSDKIGFSHDADGKPIQGIRGILERNAMRYVLSLSAYFMNRQPGKPLQTTLKNWHDYASLFQKQLQEIPWADYRQLKLQEFKDQKKLEANHGEMWEKDDW